MRNEPGRNEMPKTDGNGHDYRDTKFKFKGFR
jgi:hypothetical protein